MKSKARSEFNRLPPGLTSDACMVRKLAREVIEELEEKYRPDAVDDCIESLQQQIRDANDDRDRWQANRDACFKKWQKAEALLHEALVILAKSEDPMNIKAMRLYLEARVDDKPRGKS